jgi:hypothetical protein
MYGRLICEGKVNKANHHMRCGNIVEPEDLQNFSGAGSRACLSSRRKRSGMPEKEAKRGNSLPTFYLKNS